MGLEFDIVETARALFVSAGMTLSGAQADIREVAKDVAKEYGRSSSHEIEAEFARHLRNQG